MRHGIPACVSVTSLWGPSRVTICDYLPESGPIGPANDGFGPHHPTIGRRLWKPPRGRPTDTGITKSAPPAWAGLNDPRARGPGGGQGPGPAIREGLRGGARNRTLGPAIAVPRESVAQGRHIALMRDIRVVTLMRGLDSPIVYHVVHMTFGTHVRAAREDLRRDDRAYSVRQVARRIGVEPAYLSKIERDQVAPPSEATIRRLADELGEDPDVLLAMAGKVSSDLRDIVMSRPRLFGDVLRQLRDAPDDAIVRVVREIRDGDW